MPIGNLTSQIFANIYLNELDRYIIHSLKPLAYARYGDDFLVFLNSKEELEELRLKVRAFLHSHLKLELHRSNDLIVKAQHGIKFLGCWLYPQGRSLTKRNWSRIKERLNLGNAASYRGLVFQHGSKKRQKEFVWRLLETDQTHLGLCLGITVTPTNSSSNTPKQSVVE